MGSSPRFREKVPVMPMSDEGKLSGRYLMRIDSRLVVENVYGPPGGNEGQKSIEAFLKKKIKKPEPLGQTRLPEDEHSYRIDLGPYEAVNKPRDIGGRIAFRAQKGTTEILVNEKGAVVAREFDTVGDPVGIGGRFFFQAGLGKKQFVINERGKRVGGKYDAAGTPVDMGGRVGFRAREGDKEFIVTERAERVGGEYDFVGDPREIVGQIVFRAGRRAGSSSPTKEVRRSAGSMILSATLRR